MAKRTQARRIEFPVPFQGLFRPARYKVYYGGRGAAKSWCFARALLLKAVAKKKRILCAREYQTSIADSVHKLLAEQIAELGLSPWYEVQKTRIVSSAGSEFIFKGLRHNVLEIKSTEGIDLCWVEEAQSVSEESWNVLIPTVRQSGSEIWISFNPRDDDDPTYKRFVLSPPPNTIVRKVGWRDNPWFPEVLRAEMEYLRRVDPEGYQHVWEGETRSISDAVVFKGKYSIRPFETPAGAQFYYGADWGFSQDPTVLVRCFVEGRTLFIDFEAFAVGCDIDKIPELFDRVPGARSWPIFADSARPETISYVRRQGYNIKAADKWSGSVEDGVSYLRSFEEIVIHERCKHMADEARLYKYKVDAHSGEVLPVLVDANNHGWDSVRYALSPLIRKVNSGGQVFSFGGRAV